ncbi:MAG: FHA domain-containing serine/threonine-protein kinase [Clostridium sp.]|nr:FHA domain-containing serine/threonine-protein kinase [Bacteroides sp.]MCM1197406.1 FHA domain-containing serine/threonine-protein kinase [Clostridium sp.]
MVAERCDFSIGELIDGKYRIERSLGEGSFGIVYKVLDEDFTYALKLLKLWAVSPEVSKGLQERFMMEFETGMIKSNYLVHSYASGEVKGNPYILMEFCPKGDLRSYANSNSIDYFHVGRCILTGLRDLHSCGKVHRDLKPENVLLRQNNTAVLTDFGISGDRNKRMTERGWLGKPSQIFGTYPYMPPEQVNPPRGGQATVLPTTDIFSFGVMMYEMLVGELPFGELTEATLEKYLENGKKGRWDRNKLKKNDSTGIWSEIIDGCLVPDFRYRTQTAEEIIAKLPADETKPWTSEHHDRNYLKVNNGVLLRVMQGEEYGKEYRLDELLKGKRIITVGRNTDYTSNVLSVKENNSSYVSRHHCTLEIDYSSSSWIIRDGQWIADRDSGYWKESLNGTYVNSTEVGIGGMYIYPGDVISIGDVKFRVEGY